MRVTARDARDVEVRELERHDLVGLAQCITLDVEAFPHPSIPPGLPAGSQTLVATADAHGPVVGFLTSTARAGVRYVHGLAVAPVARRRGVARALVRDCVARARAAGLREVVLHVGAGNRPAVALYDAEGFEVHRVLRDFYRPGLYPSRHAYELVLPLGRRKPPAPLRGEDP